MKAERAGIKPEFVPVIVTLESQEEVDALFAVINHGKITRTLPALMGWWSKLQRFTSNYRHHQWDALDRVIRH